MNDLERIAKGCHHDPFTFLGAHFNQPDWQQVTIRALYPGSTRVELQEAGKKYPMKRIHPAGIYQCIINVNALTDPTLAISAYEYIVCYPDNTQHIYQDPYRLEPLLSPYDSFLFNEGKNYKIYEHLGAHRINISAIDGVVFRVWAPNAKAVSVVGDFCGWNKLQYQMRSLGISGIWEIFIPGLQEGITYKYMVTPQSNHSMDKADPFQLAPGNATPPIQNDY